MRALAASIAFLTLTAAEGPESSLEGRWRSPGGNTIIEIAPCGGSLCGTVAWASAKAQKAARKGTDRLIGAQLLTNLTQRPNGRWDGKLFIPDKNMRVTAKLQRAGQAQLKVSGCVAGNALCRSELWNRWDQALPATE